MKGVTVAMVGMVPRMISVGTALCHSKQQEQHTKSASDCERAVMPLVACSERRWAFLCCLACFLISLKECVESCRQGKEGGSTVRGRPDTRQ